MEGYGEGYGIGGGQGGHINDVWSGAAGPAFLAWSFTMDTGQKNRDRIAQRHLGLRKQIDAG